MPKFIIEPHFRLQEWVAEEKGYFAAEGLDYEFREFVRATGGAHHAAAGKVGAFQSIEQGRSANVTCACHWTVNVAASRGHTKLYADAYSVAPCGIFVPSKSSITSPDQLAGVPISVGYQSGSHYATLQALEQYLPVRGHQAFLCRRHAVRAHASLPRGRHASLHAFQRPLLLRGAVGLS